MRRCLDVAAPPASRPVQSGRPGAASLPGHAGPRAGGHQVLALREEASEPRPGSWRHTRPSPRLGAVGVGTGTAAWDTGPEFLSFGVQGTLHRQQYDTHIPALLVGDSGARSLAFTPVASHLSCWRQLELYYSPSSGPQFPHLLKEGDDPTSQYCFEH